MKWCAKHLKNTNHLIMKHYNDYIQWSDRTKGSCITWIGIWMNLNMFYLIKKTDCVLKVLHEMWVPLSTFQLLQPFKK